MVDDNVPDLVWSEQCDSDCKSVPRKSYSRSRVWISLEAPEPDRPIIHNEITWRSPEVLQNTTQHDSRLIASRWRGASQDEHSSEIISDCHMVSIATQPTEFTLSLGTGLFPNQSVIPGMVQITGPSVPGRIVYMRPYDSLHLFVPQAILVECFEWRHGRRPPNRIALRDPLFVQDTVLQKIGTTLLSLADADDAYATLHADFLNLAIATRLLGQYGEVSHQASRTVAALPRWRLRRAVEFIDANLDSPVTLADLSRSVGLSRMHFASQFRAAIGLRPHEYVLRRRVEKAQEMLASTDDPIAELALAVGFSSQAHFTTVFKRFCGVTPARWRDRMSST